MPPHINKRIPSSCEPCRRRKIRCRGTRVPCETCVRRSRPTGCYYQKNGSISSPSHPSEEGDSTCNKSVMDRLSRIERLLETHIDLGASAEEQIDNRQEPSPCSLPPSSMDHCEDTIHNKQGAAISGMLIQSPSGHVRFIAQLPGMHNMDSSLLASLSHSLGANDSSPIELSLNSDCTASSIQDLLDVLPPLSSCDRLKDLFLEVFSPLFHILHEPTFHHSYQEFRNDPYSVSLSFLALLFVTFAIAITSVADHDPLLDDLGHDANYGSRIKRLTSKYQSAAMKALSADKFLWQHNLTTLKTLVLLIYSISHTNGPAWSLLGATVNIATSIGCHVDPVYLTPTVSPVEAEERRRCWTAIMMLHTIQNACLGISVTGTVNANTALPSDIEDEDIGDVNCRGPLLPPTPKPTTSKMTYILQKFKLYQIASQICQLPLPGAPVNYMLISEHDRQIEQEAKEQDRKLAYERSISPGTHHRVQYYILSIYTNHLFLVLHRPCLHPYANISDTDRSKSLQRCMRSSTELLQRYEELCSDTSLQAYRWYVQGLGAFYALLAAVSLIVSINHPLLGEQPPVATSALARVRTVMERFSQSAHRSEMSAKGSEFLKRIVPVSGDTLPTRAGSQPESFQHKGNMSSGPNQVELYNAGGESGDAYSQSQPPGRLQSYENTDFDVVQPNSSTDSVSENPLGFVESQDLLNLVSASSHQQWLLPGSFSWETWSL